MNSVSPSASNDPPRPQTPPVFLPPQELLPPLSPFDSAPEPEPSTASSNPAQSPSPSASIDSQPSHLLLPIPKPSGNTSRASFSYPDATDDTGVFDPLSPDIASADISIAPDGSFVETSSGPAARELKRRYDQHYGVGMSVRSPYAITAFTNQHGKPMYRVGHRGMSAPGASAVDAEQHILESKAESSSSGTPSRSKRRSRMSVHALPHMFKNGTWTSKPQTTSGPQPGPRKLRKTRSIPEGMRQQGESSGRSHSQSVTSADLPSFTSAGASSTSRRHRAKDLFGEVMDWAPASSTSSISTHSLFLPGDEPPTVSFDHDKFPSVIAHPFGNGVSFSSPSRKPGIEYLRTPRLLREMQSFESGLTARQTDPEGAPEKVSPLRSTMGSIRGYELSRSPSAIRLRDSVVPSVVIEEPPPPAAEQIDAPSPETAMHSRYSPDVFDVLQTYRGLPLLDKLSLESEETTVIKMSLSADDTAAPRDDPRFVIWGDVQLDSDDVSLSQESLTDLSSSAHSSNISRKRSARASKAKSPEPPNAQVTAGQGTQKILVAATIERWIAQLTSDLNYDELLNFFLTYRTYIGSVDLCHLLICRFHWALQKPSSSSDEMVRRIVRVRTFVAFRYWLLTFFTVDFLPNRELRLLVAHWLNTLIRDPILEKHNDGLSIVKKLKKVVKDCKKAHSRTPSKPKFQSTAVKQATGKQDHIFGEKFAEATRKPDVEEEDSDVDLEFVDEVDPPPGFHTDSANAHLSTIHLGATLSPSGPNSIPLSSLSILQRTDYAPGPNTPDPSGPFVQTSATLPIHHNALSRVFVKTIGRLGRWKRVLNNRTPVRAPLAGCTDVSAFDLELSVSRDLLTVNGGVEQYLKIIEHQAPATQTSENPLPAISDSAPSPIASTSHPPIAGSSVMSSPATEIDIPPSPTPPSPSSLACDSLQSTSQTSSSPSVAAAVPLPEHAEITEPSSPPVARSDTQLPQSNVLVFDHVTDVEAEHQVYAPSLDRVSISRTSSTDSFGEQLSTVPRFQSPWQFGEVVSIDELDLSDSSSEHDLGGPSAPPGLRRPTRKLPLRRDFEFVDRPESISSMGITSHVSGASSAASSTSVAALGGIQQWQMNALVDSLSDDEETGDVEDALKRLEGQINPSKRQEKASKVDGWVRIIQERMAAGDYSNDQPRYFDDEDIEDDSLQSPSISESGGDDSSAHHDLTISTQSEPGAAAYDDNEHLDPVHTPMLPQAPAPPGLVPSPPRAKPTLEDVVPLEILQSRVVPGPASSSPPRPSPTSKFANPEAPRVHRSYILSHRAEVLAQHFAMIDRELFMGVKFEELVLDDWMACEEVNVLDWAQYLKDRARWKAESRFLEKTSALAAVRARFNLMANFTVSEVVLTQPNERPLVVAKFLRIAWKAYCLHSFNTLVAIITGLRSEWVATAMRRLWGRVGMWETRMFNDLKQWTTNAENFKHIRQTVDAIVDAKPLDTGSHAASVVSGGPTDGQSSKNRGTTDHRASVVPSVCVPFIGIYLSQLHQHNGLPDLIDPTAPNEAVVVDPITANFDAPAHPEVFSTLAPLPPSMHLEPLINVHKQRMIAGVIKSLVAGQHLASRMHYPVDKKLFQKCLRLRGLDTDTLQRVLVMHPE